MPYPDSKEPRGVSVLRDYYATWNSHQCDPISDLRAIKENPPRGNNMSEPDSGDMIGQALYAHLHRMANLRDSERMPSVESTLGSIQKRFTDLLAGTWDEPERESPEAAPANPEGDKLLETVRAMTPRQLAELRWILGSETPPAGRSPFLWLPSRDGYEPPLYQSPGDADTKS